MQKTKSRLYSTLGPLSFAAAMTAGLALGGCQEPEKEVIIVEEDGDGDGEGDGEGNGDDGDGDGDGEGLQVSPEIEEACMSYCENLAQCNEETTVDECMEKCKGVLYACEEHEEGEALDQVEDCGEVDCLALPLCTANAGIQCLTGLGL